MEVTANEKKHIRLAFKSMIEKEDFLSLLNYVKKIVYSNKEIPFELRQITFFSSSKISQNSYCIFKVEKKSGGDRIIHAPVAGLKSIQKCLNLILQIVYDVSPSANGFVPGRSIVDNAQKHVGSNYVYNIDLKDFFPTIDQARVWGRLKAEPFNLKLDRQVIGNMISGLCCTELEVERLNNSAEWIKTRKSVLPQGAPTSPVLSNIICGQLDYYLQAVANRFNLKYSRYADDITFSSMHNVYQKDSVFIKEIQRVIKSQKFYIKSCKTRLQKRGYRQEVTGLVVNEKVNVRKRYKKDIRMWLYKWENYGYSTTSEYFRLRPSAARAISFSKVIGGKINFLIDIKGGNNRAAKELKQRFDFAKAITDMLT